MRRTDDKGVISLPYLKRQPTWRARELVVIPQAWGVEDRLNPAGPNPRDRFCSGKSLWSEVVEQRVTHTGDHFVGE